MNVIITLGLCQNGGFFFPIKATCAAHGNSQARSWIGAAAAGLYTTAIATPDPSQSMIYSAPCGNAGSLTYWARGWNHILMDTIWVLNPLSHNGNTIKCRFLFMKSRMGPETLHSNNVPGDADPAHLWGTLDFEQQVCHLHLSYR